MQALKGIIFDLDGTLVDSQLNFSAMCSELDLPQHTPLLEHLSLQTDPLVIETIHAVIEKHELAGAHRAIWIEQAESVLHTLHQWQIPMAIVTRNMRRATQITVERLGIPITTILTREDTARVKPHPEALLHIANQWQIDVSALAYLGDYKYDLQAARRAGMLALLWRTPHNRELEPLADRVIDQFKQLLLAFPQP